MIKVSDDKFNKIVDLANEFRKLPKSRQSLRVQEYR